VTEEAVSNYLRSHGISAGADQTTRRLFEAEPEIATYRVSSYSKFTSRIWDDVTSRHTLSGHASGNLLQQLLAITFLKCNGGPFLVGGETELVPTHPIDFWFETEAGNVVAISSNSRLKERWRNENLAAHVLKFKHPGSRWYVVTTIGTDQANAERRLRQGVPTFLDGIVDVHSPEFDDLCRYLSGLNLRSPRTNFSDGRLIH